ncbi:hypothetical protein GF339_10340 [candidate division KSB3 bacterium]|uniref:histidine kinase n=1 Tax=candidate division KSB3 bacterium TaxID=2044937 RepID=A0A9D5Q5M2_9BACT|nr:hypothetical protein [candidate division KSB3 bacterium]MBD3324974.1 hypothetical protein [candidate division KSB3 bacterium]
MQVEKDTSSGIVLLCSMEGLIIRVLRDDLGLAAQPLQGRLVTAIAGREDFGKFLNFMVELRAQATTFNWQINVPVAGVITTLNFGGIVMENNLLIFAAKDRNGVMRLYEDLMEINNEQMNELRAIMKEQTHVAKQQESQDRLYYDELTRLYNQLATLQREIAKKNSELERLNEQKNRFLGMAAHDLRNPLGAIQMYSEFLLEEVADLLGEEHREFLAIIHSSSHFMLEIVEDFLDIAQIESGKLHLNLWPVDLVELVRNTVTLSRAIAAKKHLTIDLEHEADIPVMPLDASKIRQVLNNLISNAMKFSPPNSTITVRLSSEDAQAILAVQDHGPGIPPDEVSTMFEPFARTSVKSSGGEKSSGLGLAIARKIVEGHHGKLWVESTVGQGSTFYVALPREQTP